MVAVARKRGRPPKSVAKNADKKADDAELTKLRNELSEAQRELRHANLMTERYKALADIMMAFDFGTVDNVMHHLKWVVCDSQTEDSIPCTSELKDMAESLIKSCWEAFDSGEATEEWSVRTGPFLVQWFEGDDGVFGDLVFACTDYHYEPYEEPAWKTGKNAETV